ncbi:MAG: zinc-ribbon domain-containing protein [Gammaproteobacteria bacterium]|nr:zinc-ribbon domain-containing protein [Gammaproteobacteria bacterium]MDH4315244.1 zinc-ribbon domain-containing protein [Gammaproteobacteria bacterium]MDH5214484.1 zinc-ribbon domain-containing protein [Gammaproteobacteria bacterium]MDH5499694.1 zinc-ribbon domain-containing protein [Gammaproteobacteria bacterium]
MYTQCPECQTAFRVTARVLQQAAGKVRCGGCGSAFSALDYLSEDPPPVRDESAAPDTESQSKKLLETLEQLAGPENVVIEDTGVEWQVLDEDADDNDAGGQNDTGSLRWMLEGVDEADEDAAALPEIVDEVPLAHSADDKDAGVMRFDDNTPLPDDFDDIVTESPPSPQRRSDDRIEQEARHFDEMQIDLALGEPDEWVDLLDEVEDEASRSDSGIPIEVEEELAAIHSELTSRPGRSTAAPRPSTNDNEPDDVESQFDSQAEALGLDVTGSRGKPAFAEDIEADVPDGTLREEIGETGEGLALSGDEGEEADREPTSGTRARDLESTGDFEDQIEAARAALAGEEMDDTEGDDSETGEYPLSLASDAEISDSDDDVEFLDDDDDIAERVLRGELQAAEDSSDDLHAESSAEAEGQPDVMGKPDVPLPPKKSRYPDYLFDENAENVETIIMEGEFVHGSLRDELVESQNKASNFDEAAFLADTYSLNRKKIRGGRRKTDPPGFGIIAGAIVLALLLAGQVMHNYRQMLSTVGAFNQTIAPIYRMLGQPIIPEWDIKGWQFQATNGSTSDDGKLLTIFSTIANRSTQALPYPLVHVSLTDRWEEIIGSRVLEPNEYLAGDLDPSTPVAAGDKFTAVISISSPSADATGFKLNVCYRVGPGQVRCATEDFKE